MASTFHPQLFRGANNTTTSSKSSTSCGSVSVTASTTSSTSVRHPPATSPLPSSIISNTTNAPSAATTPTPTSTSNSASASSSPIHGLQVDPSQFPPHPAFVSSSSQESDCRVRLISADQYADLIYQHSNIKLQDERVLFPWMHGADLPFSAQAENFGFKNGQFQAVPK